MAGRVQAALTALAFVLSSLAGLIHGATTRHVQCAEHGEQIHSDAAAPGAIRSAGATGWIARTDLAAMRGQPAAAIHGHEHCWMASATRESRIAPGPPSLTATTEARAAIVAVAPPVTIVRHDPVYRTAPKTSPPA